MVDTMLSFSDNKLSSNFLTIDEIRKKCPSVFKTVPTNPNVSEKYTHVNTATVIDDLSKLGWYPTEAKQCRQTKKSSGIRSFHMISFQNPDVKICKPVTDDNGNVTEVVDSYPRIILTNSHDGFNSFKFMVGLYRLVCSNGLVVSSAELLNMTVRHINYDFSVLREIVNTSIEKIPSIISTMNTMRHIELSNDEKKELATAVVKIRKGVEDDEQINVDDETIADILQPVRTEDKSNDLWTIFNVCQEKMIKGGYMQKNKFEKYRRQRSITSIKKDIEYNQRLWLAASKYLSKATA